MLLPQEIKAEDASLIKDYGVKDYIRVSKDFPHSEQNPWKLEPKFYPGQHLEFLGD